MLRIRKSQLWAFQSAADADFERRVADFVRAEHPEAAVRLTEGESTVAELPDDVLLRLVRSGVARARSYGMAWESSLTAFVVLMFVVAPNFDTHPLIRHVLEDEQVAPDARLDQLWEQTTHENWEAAADSYDPQSWDAPAHGE